MMSQTSERAEQATTSIRYLMVTCVPRACEKIPRSFAESVGFLLKKSYFPCLVCRLTFALARDQSTTDFESVGVC